MKALSVLVLVVFSLSNHSSSELKKQTGEYPRVKCAYEKRKKGLTQVLRGQQISFDNLEIFIRVFKKEYLLEVWARNKNASTFKLLKSYSICQLSGVSGPKRKSGDGQVPEGFYYIDRFNAQSNYHLSLGINYPNVSDKILSPHKDLGGDIFIHGRCVSIGCIAITDPFVEEVYVLALQAKNAGQKNIPVHIFPSKVNSEKLVVLRRDTLLKPFWDNLAQGYSYFETNKKLPIITINKQGKYLFQ